MLKEDDVPPGTIHICAPESLPLCDHINGVFIPRVNSNTDIIYTKMGDSQVNISFNNERRMWEIQRSEELLCKVRLPASEYCLPLDCSADLWSFRYQQSNEFFSFFEQDCVGQVMSVLAPPDNTLLNVVGNINSTCIPVANETSYEQNSDSKNSSLYSSPLKKPLLDVDSTEDDYAEISLSEENIFCVSRARVTAAAMKSMIRNGIDRSDLDMARATKRRSHDDGDELEFTNPVIAFNDLKSCRSEEYAIKARLVGDDRVDRERILFALRMDTLEILNFSVEKLLLPKIKGKSRQEMLEEVVADANAPPTDDAVDKANCRLILDMDASGNVTVSKCVQEKHFSDFLGHTSPKMLLCGALAKPIGLVLSNDLLSILEVFTCDLDSNVEEHKSTRLQWLLKLYRSL